MSRISIYRSYRLYFLNGGYSGGRRPPPLVIQIVFIELLGHTDCISWTGSYKLYFLFGTYRLYFLDGVVQIVFLGRGRTNCISWSGSYKLYLLFWDIQIVFLGWEYSGGRRPPPLVI
jgi:hypothetical protein